MKRIVVLLPLVGGCLGSSDQADMAPPVIVITSPTSSTVTGNVTFAATVVDDFGVDEVEFFADEISLLKDNVPPYEVVWLTANFSNKTVLLKVTARDINGNSSLVTKTVTVNNEPN